MPAASQAAVAQNSRRRKPRRMKRPRGNRLGQLLLHLANIYRLTIKEMRSFRSDPIMLLLVAYAFTIAIYAAATGASTEATNLSVGIVDEDRSDLSRRIADGLTPPTFQPAVEIAHGHHAAMDSQRFVFRDRNSPEVRGKYVSRRRRRFKSMSMPPRWRRPSTG